MNTHHTQLIDHGNVHLPLSQLLGMAGTPQFAVPRENLDSEIFQILHKSSFEAVHTKKVLLPRALLNI